MVRVKKLLKSVEFSQDEIEVLGIKQQADNLVALSSKKYEKLIEMSEQNVYTTLCEKPPLGEAMANILVSLSFTAIVLGVGFVVATTFNPVILTQKGKSLIIGAFAGGAGAGIEAVFSPITKGACKLSSYFVNRKLNKAIIVSEKAQEKLQKINKVKEVDIEYFGK